MNIHSSFILIVIIQLQTLFAHNSSNLDLHWETCLPSIGISITPSHLTPIQSNVSRNQAINLVTIQSLHPQILNQYLTSIAATELFNHFYFYSNQNYLDHIRLRSGYRNFITKLHQEIHSNHSFRKSLRNITGFKRKRGFQELIENEVKRINEIKIQEQHSQEQKQAAIEQQKKFNHEQELKNQATHCKEMILKKLFHRFGKQYNAAQQSQDYILQERFQRRIDAVTQTIDNSNPFDYSNMINQHPIFTDPDAHFFDQCHGTFLDKQLHEELCFTRTTMHDLLANNHHSSQIQAFSQMIDHLTALSKQEQSIEKAFDLSDFTYNLSRIISGGINILNRGIDYMKIGVDAGMRGIARGVRTTLNAQHWKDMGIGLLELGALFANEAAHNQAFDNAIIASVITGNPDIVIEASKTYEQHHLEHAHVVRQSLENLRQMTWERLIENGAHLGTTFVLDGIICHAATLCATKAGRALVSQLAGALNSSAASEHVVEIIGVGKIALEEGPEVATAVIESVNKNPGILAQESKYTVEVLKKTTENIARTPKINNAAPASLEAPRIGIIRGGKDAIAKTAQRYTEHIFSAKHKKNGIFDLVKPELDNGIIHIERTQEKILAIFEKIVHDIDTSGLLKEGTNNIKTFINNIETTIQVHIENGALMSMDGYTGGSNRAWKDTITWPQKQVFNEQ